MRTMKRAAPDLVAIADLIDFTPAAQGAATYAELLDVAQEWTDCGFAPDMLAALQYVLGEAMGQHADPEATLAAIAGQVRAAIARAEGR